MFLLLALLPVLSLPACAGFCDAHATVMTFQLAPVGRGVSITKPLCLTQQLNDEYPSGFEGFQTGVPVTPVFRRMGAPLWAKSC